ncbi:MAG TPA: hypothetical protein VMV91_06995 [Rhodocyclaceae bacterium]|nr:hypothetical protein [Rhodocyclaceae bacterium]
MPRDGSDLAPPGETAQPSLALGGLAMSGFTAFIGLLEGRNFGVMLLAHRAALVRGGMAAGSGSTARRRAASFL